MGAGFTYNNNIVYGVVAAIAVGTAIAVAGIILGTEVNNLWYALFAGGEVITFGAIGFNWWALTKSRRNPAG